PGRGSSFRVVEIRACGIGPSSLLGRGGTPVFPPMREVARRGTPCPGFRQGGPGLTGRTCATGPTLLARERLRPTARHPASLRFGVQGRWAPPGLTTGGFCSDRRPGT